MDYAGHGRIPEQALENFGRVLIREPQDDWTILLKVFFKLRHRWNFDPGDKKTADLSIDGFLINDCRVIGQ